MRHLAYGVWAAVAAWLALQLAIGLFVTAWPGAATDVVTLGGIHALVLGGAAYLVAARGAPQEHSTTVTAAEGDSVRRSEWWRSNFGLIHPRLWLLVLGGVIGVVAKIPADAFRALIEVRYPTDELELLQQWNLLRHETWWQSAMLFVVIGFTGPLFEEIFYRGVLFARLERGVGGVAAWLTTSAVFAVSHPSVRDWPSLWLVGLVLGDLRRVHGSIWACLGAHIAFNSATLLAVVTGAQTASAEPSFEWTAVVGSSGLLALLLILSRRLF